MTPSPSFDELLAGLAVNDPRAADRLSRETFRRLLGLIRSRVGERFQSKVDAEEVLNSALGSFLRRHAESPYDLGSWEDLWALLNQIARCKLSNHRRLYQGKIRSVDREVARDGIADPLSPVAAPDEDVVLNDLLEHLMTGYSDAERAVIEMSLDGHSVEQIAAALGRTGRTVIRIRKRFRGRLEVEQSRTTED